MVAINYSGSYHRRVTFQFQLDEDDFVDAHLAHLRKTVGASGWKPIFALAIFGPVLIFSAIRIIIALFLIFSFLAAYIWSGIPFRRQFRKLKSLHKPMEISVGDEVILYRSATGESKSRWEAFEAWKESKKSFLLYTQPRLFFIVPKRVMQTDEVAVFRELLRSRIRQVRKTL